MRVYVLLASLCLLGVPACDDNSTMMSGMDLTAHVPDMAYASSCGVPGDKALNATGVGLFCEQISDCAAPTGSTGWKATLCSSIGDATSHFCTFVCTASSECGTGATCVCANIGCGCTPNKCAPPDGGV